MFIENFLFNLFFLFIVSSAFFVILSTNAVYSVLFLILTSCNVVLLLLLIGAEFIAFLLLIVYVGAIAVLFLFVVMMLNIQINKKRLNKNYVLYYLPLILISGLFLLDYFYSFTFVFDVLNQKFNLQLELNWVNWVKEIDSTNNIKSIGSVFYTNYCLLFFIASLILLVAMIGVIVLTIHQKSNNVSKKQKIASQLNRNSKEIIKFIYIRK